jgi:membrane-bound acyltransferase YfiQ involved in biofilm formation
MFHLWYIPVLLILFALTPAIEFIRRRQAWLLWLIVAAPLLCSRTWPSTGVMTVVYFLGAYSLGVLIGANYPSWLALLRRHVFLLSNTAAATSLVLILLYLWAYEDSGVVSLKESVFYLQKLALAGLVLLGLQRLQSSLPVWIDVMARYSFAVYFLHGFVLYASLGLLHAYRPDRPSFTETLILGGLILFACILVSLLVARSAKALLGGKSRYLVGA